MNFNATLVVDDFLPDPDAVRDLALSDKIKWYTDPEGRWPGKRSQLFHEIDHGLFTSIMRRYFSLFYSDETLDNQIHYAASMSLQKVSTKEDCGWIHSDYPSTSTFIIYLTPKSSPSSGTALYKQKTIMGNTALLDIKRKSFLGEISMEEAESARLENNSYYEKNLHVGDVYNRMFSFDSYQYHGAQELKIQDDQERLTIIAFIEDVCGPATPLQRSKCVPIHLDRGDYIHGK